jgi:peptidoglycan-N-acetylglucosamine deacetylase
MSDSDSARLTRRSLLRIGVATAGASALAVLAEAFGGRAAASSATPTASTGATAAAGSATPIRPWQTASEAELASQRQLMRPGTVSPSGTGLRPPVPVNLPHPPTYSPHKPPTEPPWVHTWDSPISTLDDFVRRSPSTHYAKNAIMLTIDDGPNSEWTPKYLRLLAKHDVQATFCVIGEQIRTRETLVRAAVSEGHHIANHTWTHPLNLPYLTGDQIHRELERTTDAVVSATGFRPRQFRAPGGVWGPDVFREVSKQQMMPLGWDIDPRDWSLPGVSEIRSAMLAARPHDIILCHDGGGNRSETYAALETVIPALLARGWKFVTLPAPHTV